LLEQVEDELIDLIGKRIADTIADGNFPGIVPVAFMETRKRTGDRAFALLEGGRDSRFPVKLKRSLMPVIMAAFHIPPGNTQVVYALDFYLSGIISLMTEWQRNGQELSVDELGALVRTILTEGVLKAIGQAR